MRLQSTSAQQQCHVHWQPAAPPFWTCHLGTLLARSYTSTYQRSVIRRTCLQPAKTAHHVYPDIRITSKQPSNAAQEHATDVLFSITHATQFGQHMRVVGSHAALAAWDINSAPAMTWHEGHTWTLHVTLPPGKHEFKYVLVHGSGHADWEPGPNRTLLVPSSAVISPVKGSWGQPNNTDVLILQSSNADAPTDPVVDASVKWIADGDAQQVLHDAMTMLSNSSDAGMLQAHNSLQALLPALQQVTRVTSDMVAAVQGVTACVGGLTHDMKNVNENIAALQHAQQQQQQMQQQEQQQQTQQQQQQEHLQHTKSALQHYQQQRQQHQPQAGVAHHTSHTWTA
eukprot:jgi/Chrzof1/7547/Cz02g27260.t1